MVDFYGWRNVGKYTIVPMDPKNLWIPKKLGSGILMMTGIRIAYVSPNQKRPNRDTVTHQRDEKKWIWEKNGFCWKTRAVKV